MSALCPDCNKEITLPEGATGKKIRCGGCGLISRIERGPGGGYKLVPLGRPRAEEAAAPTEAEAETPAPARAPKRRVASGRSRERGRAHTQIKSSPPERGGRRERSRGVPGAVIAVAAILCFNALASIVIGALILLGAGFLGAAVATHASDPDAEGVAKIATIFGLLGGFALLLGFGQLASGIGILRGSSIARRVAIALFGLGLLAALGKLGLRAKLLPDAELDLSTLGSLVLSGLSLVLLFLRPTVEHCANPDPRARGRGSRGARGRAGRPRRR